MQRPVLSTPLPPPVDLVMYGVEEEVRGDKRKLLPHQGKVTDRRKLSGDLTLRHELWSSLVI